MIFCLSFFVKHPVYLHIEELYTHNSNPTYFLDNSFSFFVFQIKCNAKKKIFDMTNVVLIPPIMKSIIQRAVLEKPTVPPSLKI